MKIHKILKFKQSNSIKKKYLVYHWKKIQKMMLKKVCSNLWITVLMVKQWEI